MDFHTKSINETLPTLNANAFRLSNEDNKNYAKLSRDILNFPFCILDKKFNPFIKGRYHFDLVTNQTFKYVLDTVFY